MILREFRKRIALARIDAVYRFVIWRSGRRGDASAVGAAIAARMKARQSIGQRYRGPRKPKPPKETIRVL